MNQALPRGTARSISSRPWHRGALAAAAGVLTLLFGVTAASPAAADPGETGVIKGYVYADAGNDGYFDVDETPISDIEMTLQSGGVEIGTVRTDDAGQFSFEGLRPGTYRVLERQPKDYRDGAEAVGGDGSGKVVNDDEIEITLRQGQVSSGHLFGEIPARPGVSNPDFPVVIAGHPQIFDPLANDGVMDAAAVAFDPRTLRLLDPATGLPVKDLTLPGEAHLRVLEDGRVEITPQAGFLGWTAEVGYEASTYDGRHSAAVIGVEVQQRLTSGGSGRQVTPS